MRVLTADERAYVESYGVPIDAGRSFFIASLHPESLLPTPTELRQIRSFIEYKITSFYTDRFAAQLLAMPLPGDSGHNTTCLRKGHMAYGGEDWYYARSTWTQIGWPNPASSNYQPLGLLEVIDHSEQGLGGEVDARWTKWRLAAAALTHLAPTPLGPRSRPSSLALRLS